MHLQYAVAFHATSLFCCAATRSAMLSCSAAMSICRAGAAFCVLISPHAAKHSLPAGGPPAVQT